MLLTHRIRQHKYGFTLLELLVVLAILAIVGGGLLVAYDNLDDKASEGVAAHTLASLDSAVRSYINVEQGLPNDLDSLIAASYPGAGTPVNTTGATHLAILPENILTKKTTTTSPFGLSQAQFDALVAAGITSMRYVDSNANNLTTGGTLGCPDADGNTSQTIGPISDIDIPHRAFEVPRPGSGGAAKNRGRGFSAPLAVGSPVLQWEPNRSGGEGGYDNIKLGAGPEDVIILLGLGNDSSMIGPQAGRAQLPSAPVYGKRANKYEYGRYFLAVNLGPANNTFSKARLQAVLNTHGDFVDEMITEYIGQKN